MKGQNLISILMMNSVQTGHNIYSFYSFNSSLHNISYTPYNLVNSVIVARTIFIKIMSMLLVVVVNKIKR